MEHVAQKFLHFGVANDLFKESFLDAMRIAKTQIGQEHQKTTESSGIAGRTWFNVVSKHGQGLVLKIFDLSRILQSRSLCKIKDDDDDWIYGFVIVQNYDNDSISRSVMKPGTKIYSAKVATLYGMLWFQAW